MSDSNKFSCIREALTHFVNEYAIHPNNNCVPGFVSGCYEGWGKARNYIRSLMERFPLNGVPKQSLCFFKDGNKWFCVHGDFEDLQSSPSGVGDTFEDALESLKKESSKVSASLAGEW